MQVPDDPSSLLVTDAGDLAEVCAAARAAGRLALDTEFIGERSYRTQVCLVQVATADRVALIDPLRVDVAPFWGLVTDPALCKVVHAGRQDLELCFLATGRAPANVFDVQVAAGLVGPAYPMSYGRLVERMLGVRLEQGETFSEWAQRPLRPEQLKYAVEDVLYLLPLADMLHRMLCERGRMDWLREEMASMERADFYARQADDAWRRVRGAAGLGHRHLAVLRELAIWREQAAERQDVPARSLLRDDVLVALARHMPRTREELVDVRGMPTPLALRHGQAILDAIRRGRAVPQHALPQASEPKREVPVERMMTDLACAVGHSLCLEGDVAHSLLATRNDYEELAMHCCGEGRPEGAPPALMTGWRRRFAGEKIAAVLTGKAAIRRTGPPPRPRIEIF